MKKYFISLLMCCLATMSFAQTVNSAGDIIDYKEVDGKIIVTAMVNGKMGDFALDLAGHCTIMESEMSKFGIDPDKKGKFAYKDFVCRDYTPKYSVSVGNISIGSIVATMEANFFVIADEPYLKELGVVGTVDASLFKSVVFTIDASRKKITITAPFRPPYIKLDHRADSKLETGTTITFNVMIDNVPCNVTMDTWNSALLSLSAEDYAKFSANKSASKNGVISMGYGKNEAAKKQFSASSVSFVNSKMDNATVVENSSLKKSSIGMDFLREGIISFDNGRGKVYFQPHGMVSIDDSAMLPKEVPIESGKMNAITANYFKENIFDYTKGGKFKSKSDKIYVIDFWATWCGPCMKMLPEMEKMAAKYKDKIIFCKVNADKEKQLCNAYNITALPTIFIIPAGGEPIVEIGAMPDKVQAKIEELLNNIK